MSRASQIPGGQLGRYLLVGVWNTGFSYVTFALITRLLENQFPHSYMAAYGIASIVNITVSFLGYKWFVFKTKGSYLREWIRCLGVYSTGTLLSLVLLPVLVLGVKRVTGDERSSPYLAGALLTGINVAFGFFGHKHVSFRRA